MTSFAIDCSHWQAGRDSYLEWRRNISELEFQRAYKGSWGVRSDGLRFMGGWFEPQKTFSIKSDGFFIPKKTYLNMINYTDEYGSLIIEEDYNGESILYAYDEYGYELFREKCQVSFSLKEKEKEMALVEGYNVTLNFDADGDCVTVGLIGEPNLDIPEKIIFNGITTICIFKDGEKVISRPSEHDRFDKEFGVMACIAKRIYGSRQAFLKAIENAYDQNDL